MSILKFIFATLVLMSNLVLASEDAGKEAQADEKQADQKGAKPEDKRQPEWVELQGRIGMLESKVNAKQTNINRLIEEKKKLPADSPRVPDIVKELVSEYKEYRDAVLEYEKQSALLKYRFPERGLKEERQYEVIELKTLDEMEAQLGIDGRLDRNLKRMQQQYGGPQAVAPVKPKKKSDAKSEGRPIGESPNIILQK
ncbi:MAG: hypothetical protein BroJett040_18470 [Oligoflexia bacterium]|nr:MAG: hypothetical protein BroJett040_18470 [Oligoflexia bacterium]